MFVAKCLNRQLSSKLCAMCVCVCVLLPNMSSIRFSSNSRCWFIILLFFYIETFFCTFFVDSVKVVVIVCWCYCCCYCFPSSLFPFHSLLFLQISYFTLSIFCIPSLSLPPSPSHLISLSVSLLLCSQASKQQHGIVPRECIHTAMANINNYRACLYYQK